MGHIKLSEELKYKLIIVIEGESWRKKRVLIALILSALKTIKLNVYRQLVSY
jgi:hypothetical protein